MTPTNDAGQNNSQKDGRQTFSYIPAAALKRFADELGHGDAKANKFLQVNRERVHNFIEKPYNYVNPRQSDKNKSTHVAGINNYDFHDQSTNSFIHLQKQPEFQSSLGPRSRFGEGDGSFFDRWLNSDTASSKHLYDKDGFPIMRFSLKEVSAGFKHHIKDYKGGSIVEGREYYVKPYSVRRQERLEREQQEKNQVTPFISAEGPQTSDKNSESQFQPTLVKQDGTEARLTAIEKENYFGAEARSAFFEYFHHLSRQRFSINPDSSAHRSTDSNSVCDRAEPVSNAVFATKRSASKTFIKTPVVEDSLSPHSWMRGHEQRQTEEEKQLMLEHLLAVQATSVTKTRPLSARTKFLKGCVERGIVPHPSLIIRREITSMLNVSSLGMGNEVALLLSEALDTLPLLVGLSIADNNLTDIGLVPIVNKLAFCGNLRLFDLSNNKVDSLTADALRKFLSSDACNLVVLRMQNANVDDYEASQFMDAIAVRHTVKELDLCHNLLGSHEFAVKKKQLTGGEAIGQMLRSPACLLQILKLAWNMIRFDSAKALMSAIQYNQTLTYLDLSFNHIGSEGGEILGSSLHHNSTLRVLKVAHNNLTARPTLVIFAGVKSCQSLRELDISENPIGKEGAKGLLSLNITHGDRIKINIKNCSVRVSDPSCWFEPFNPKGDYNLNLGDAYERSVCFELLNIVSRDKDLEIKKFCYQSMNENMSVDLALQIFVQPSQLFHSQDGNIRYDEISLDDSNFQSTETNLTEGKVEIDVESSYRYQGKLMIETLKSDVNSIRDLFRETSNRIFEQYDTDHSGWLDREELAYILDQLGLQGSHNLVDKLFSIYDTDHSGKVEEEEFISFLMDVKKSLEKDNFFHTAHRYLYNPLDPLNELVNFVYQVCPDNEYYYLDYSGPKPVPYIPPTDGRASLVIGGHHQSAPVFIENLSSVTINHDQSKQMEHFLNASQTLTEGFALFEFALDATKWSINEARTFYKMMIKEIGSPIQVLLKLLPHMVSVLDARMLIADTLNHDFQQIQLLKTFLGPLYRIYIGLVNGFYALQLSEDNDRHALNKLMEINFELMKKRRDSGRGDTSQYGDWMCFRNTSLDNCSILLTAEWFRSIPEKGRLEFDFIFLENDAFCCERKEISNLRLFRLLLSLGLTDETKRRRMFNKLQTNHEDGRSAAKGLGNKKYETLPNSAKNIAEYLEILYDGYAFKRVSRPNFMELTKEESHFIDDKKKKRVNTGSNALANGGDTDNGTRRFGKSDMAEPMERSSYLPAKSVNFRTGIIASDLFAVEVYGHHIKDLIQEYNNNRSALVTSVDPAFIAFRVLDALETILSGRYLTCAQVGFLLEKFLFGNILISDYSTYRVELIVSLYSRIVDLVNVEYILKELESHEIAMLYFRVGFLNVWSSLKPEGYVFLNLSRLEERKVAKILIVLNYIEKGETWIDPRYRESILRETTITSRSNSESLAGNGEQAAPDNINSTATDNETWTLPHTWYSEEGLPWHGILSLQYFSGKGKQINGCEPNVPARIAFMSYALASPYEEDVKQSKTEVNVEFTELLLQQQGIKLNIQQSGDPAHYHHLYSHESIKRNE